MALQNLFSKECWDNYFIFKEKLKTLYLQHSLTLVSDAISSNLVLEE